LKYLFYPLHIGSNGNRPRVCPTLHDATTIYAFRSIFIQLSTKCKRDIASKLITISWRVSNLFIQNKNIYFVFLFSNIHVNFNFKRVLFLVLQWMDVFVEAVKCEWNQSLELSSSTGVSNVLIPPLSLFSLSVEQFAKLCLNINNWPENVLYIWTFYIFCAMK
jgi:hypothetical protein